jgi:hypothetical protein
LKLGIRLVTGSLQLIRNSVQILLRSDEALDLSLSELHLLEICRTGLIGRWRRLRKNETGRAGNAEQHGCHNG